MEVPKLEEWKPEPTKNFSVKADYVKPPKMEDPRITRLKLIAKEKKLLKKKKAVEEKKVKGPKRKSFRAKAVKATQNQFGYNNPKKYKAHKVKFKLIKIPSLG